MEQAFDIRRLLAGIGNGYTLVRALGDGLRAASYHVRDESGRDFVLKVVHPFLVPQASDRMRALRELEVTSKLRHPNILPVIAHGSDGEELYYLVPYVHGGSLSDRLLRSRRFSAEEALRIATDIGDALRYAHRHGIIHANVSPQEILFDGDLPVIREFGLSRALGAEREGDRITAVGIVTESPNFLTPEHLVGGPLGPHSDVYGLALLFSLMISGDVPMLGPSALETVRARLRGIRPEELPVAVPPQLRSLLAQALDPDPSKRPAAVEEFIALLSSHLPAAPEPERPAAAPVIAAAPRPVVIAAPPAPPVRRPALGSSARALPADSRPRVLYAGTLFGQRVPIAAYPLVAGIALAIYIPMYLADSPRMAMGVGVLAAVLLVTAGLVFGFGLLSPAEVAGLQRAVDNLGTDTRQEALAVVPRRSRERPAPKQPMAGLRFQYEVLRQLGEGGMARVFLAKDLRYRDRTVAIKLMRPEFVSSDFVLRFHNEINIIASFSHPGILPLLDSGDVEGQPFFVMPYVDGDTLRARLLKQGSLPLPVACSIVASVARALQYAHDRTVVHRDIKPENILLQGDLPMLADFGIALMTERSPDDRRTQGSLGTPAYMSPEQWERPAEIGPASDQYSLGCVLFELLTGTAPYVGTPSQLFVKHCTAPIPSLRALLPEAPERVEAIVTRMMQKAHAERFASIGDVAQLLEGSAGLPEYAAP